MTAKAGGAPRKIGDAEKARRHAVEGAGRKARPVAEAAAGEVIAALGVWGDAPPRSPLEAELRGRLLKCAGVLAKGNDPDKAGGYLQEELGYDLWMRLTVARFLLDNGLLVMGGADGPVPVTPEMCARLAGKSGACTPLLQAAWITYGVFPQLARADLPTFAVDFPPASVRELAGLLDALDPATFRDIYNLGWIYQGWQIASKDAINKSGRKISGRDIAPVTQLLSEPYMIRFLLDNGVGAWWASRVLSARDLETAGSEDELRAKAALPGMPLEYLRFVRGEGGAWELASSGSPGWPSKASEITLIDPCCGAGFFLAEALGMLTAIRMETEGLGPEAASDAVLRDNLDGVDIDPRCAALSVFALAFSAWARGGRYRPLPEISVACSGLGLRGDRESWTALAGGDPALEEGMAALHSHMGLARTLGSLIHPEAVIEGLKGAFRPEWKDVEPLLEKALSAEPPTVLDAIR
jgi:hypothetical protein